jgi:transcriptional regulator with XRE-family HTH domain
MPANFLKRLYEICGTANLAEVSRMTDVPYNTLKNYTSGERLPSADVLIQIRDKIGADLNWLLLGDKPGVKNSFTDDTVDDKLYIPASGEGVMDIEVPTLNIRVRFAFDRLTGETASTTQTSESRIPLYTSAPTKERKGGRKK